MTPRGDGRSGDRFDEIGDERQAVGIVVSETRIGGLAKAAQVADGAHRPPAIIVTFRRPTGARRIMQGSIESEVHLHIPLQIAHEVPHTADFFHGR